MNKDPIYKKFLHSRTKEVWKQIGIRRRSGVVIPLFSVYSDESIGIGEIADLKLVIDWCVKTGMSIVQLLPLNETGIDFAPYNAISSFALEPMYLRLTELIEVNIDNFNKEILSLRRKFSKKKNRVDYRIKKEKLRILWKMFLRTNTDINDFNEYVRDNRYWLRDYAVFKILKEDTSGKTWEKWPVSSANYRKSEARKIEKKNFQRIRFFYWIQWQLYKQMKEVKEYAASNGVLLMGDLPFLSARDSADVWAHQNYFKMNLSAGAPPDMYFAFGQKWGMPPYNWDRIRKDNYIFLKEKLKYAEKFYDMYRIDHFVGLFRIWTTKTSPLPSPKERESNKEAFDEKFDPEENNKWESHGKKIINAMLRFSSMLPCGEDLGTVPECSYKTLREYGIPGIDFQRFNKDKKHNFVQSNNYRINSSSVISTHDSSFFPLWWDHEAGTIDRRLFEYLCRAANIKGKRLKEIIWSLFYKSKSNHSRLFWKSYISKPRLLKVLKLYQNQAIEIIKLYNDSFGEKEKFLKYLSGRKNDIKQSSFSFQKDCIEVISSSASVFSIQLLQEYLFLEKSMFSKMHKWNYRINQPGSGSLKNWSIKMPGSLEKLLKNNSLINEIREINDKTKRI